MCTVRVLVWKSSGRLADGREIIYFDESPGLGRASVPDQRPLAAPAAGAPSPDTARGPDLQSPGLRWDALTGEWVVIAAQRQDRTFLPPTQECPLCPSRPGRLTEIPAADYDVVVFENRFPSLRGAVPTPDPRTPGPRTPDRLGDGDDRLLLADDARMQLRLHLQQLLPLALEHLRHRNPCPARYHLRDLLGGRFPPRQRAVNFFNGQVGQIIHERFLTVGLSVGRSKLLAVDHLWHLETPASRLRRVLERFFLRKARPGEIITHGRILSRTMGHLGHGFHSRGVQLVQLLDVFQHGIQLRAELLHFFFGQLQVSKVSHIENLFFA